MTKIMCDLCGNSVNCGDKPGRKVKVKVYNSWFGINAWRTLDICDNCKKAIIERSKTIAKIEEYCRNDVIATEEVWGNRNNPNDSNS